VVRKRVPTGKGQMRQSEQSPYFFHITNDCKMTTEQLALTSNGRRSKKTTPLAGVQPTRDVVGRGMKAEKRKSPNLCFLLHPFVFTYLFIYL